MAAGSWKIYNESKKKIGNTTINLAATTWRLALFGSASNAPTATLSLLSEISGQVASGNGYSSSGKALGGEVWTVSAGGAGTWKFDTSDIIFTASGGTIADIKFAVVYASGASAGACHLLCYCTLTSSAFTLGSGSTLTIQQPATGLFVMH